MSVKLSPIYNDAQLINAIPATGAQLFVYAAGSSTKINTYTDVTGSVPQSNPIILNSRGEPSSPIWLTSGLSYKFVFAPSTDTDPPSSPIRTIDNVTGVNDTSLTIDQWIVSNLTPTYVSATQFTLAGDQTSNFTVNRRVKCTVTVGTVYGYISVSAYTTLTTVTVVLDSGVLDSGLSAVQYGILTPTNVSYPATIATLNSPEFTGTPTAPTAPIGTSTTQLATTAFVINNGTPELKTISATVSSNNLTIGMSTIQLAFRSATITDGTVSIISASPTSIVVPSGATLGSFNSTSTRLYVIAMNNAGTAELAVINRSGGNPLDETGLISTTVLDTSSDTINVAYSTTARTNLPYRVVGFIDISETTAGTWATAPTQIQGMGGNALLNASNLTSATSQATTSGTAIDFTGIPSWAKRITVMLNGVSTSGTSAALIQLGSGSPTTSGYTGSSSVIGASAVATTNLSSGFVITMTTEAATAVRHGQYVFSVLSGNIWTCFGSASRSDTNINSLTSGSVTLSGTLDRVRLTTVNGTDTFDAGSVNIMWE